MRTEVLKLKAIGRMPNGYLNDVEQTDKLLEQYDGLLSAIEKPRDQKACFLLNIGSLSTKSA